MLSTASLPPPRATANAGLAVLPSGAPADAPPAPLLTIVTTPHPTSAFSHDIDSHIARKIARNRDHRYDTLAQAREKQERYLQKSLSFIAGIRAGRWQWEQRPLPPECPIGETAADRLRGALEGGSYPGPTVRQEGERGLRQMESTLQAMFGLAGDPSAQARAVFDGFAQPRTWSGRDNDRSRVAWGDHSHQFARQVESCCDLYWHLLEGHAERQPFFPSGPVLDLLAEALRIATDLRRLMEPRAADEACLAAFVSQPPNDLRAVEARIRACCAACPQDPFSAFFDKFGIAGFAGEVRLNGATLAASAPAADRQRTEEVLREIALLHRIYPDTRSVVIAHFSDPAQVAVLRVQLNLLDPAPEIIPLLERPEDVAMFIAQAAHFVNLEVGTVMLSGSALAREAGSAQAIVLRWQLNQCCTEHGLVACHGTGTSVRRNGVGISEGPHMQSALRGLFLRSDDGRPAGYRHTLQGADAALRLGNPVLARRFLERRHADLAGTESLEDPGAPPAQAAAVFAALTAHELALRSPSGWFADFYRRHPVMRDLRNSSVHHGSRDAPRPGLNHLYEDCAINVDASVEFFQLAALPFFDLAQDPAALHKLSEHARCALQRGNPVVRDIVTNYAVQASTLYFEPLCLGKWQAAGFTPDDTARLQVSRQAMLQFLADVGQGLDQSTELQGRVMEYLGIADRFQPGQPAENLVWIERRRTRCEQAGIAALAALRTRDDPAADAGARRLAALELHLQLSAAYVYGLGAKS